MPEEAWGVKRLCPETGKRFYDLNKDPIVSPYTGKEYELSFFEADKSKTSMTDKADKVNVMETTEDDLTDDVDVLDETDTDIDMDDDILDDDDDDTVPLEEIADVSAPEEET